MEQVPLYHGLVHFFPYNPYKAIYVSSVMSLRLAELLILIPEVKTSISQTNEGKAKISKHSKSPNMQK